MTYDQIILLFRTLELFAAMLFSLVFAALFFTGHEDKGKAALGAILILFSTFVMSDSPMVFLNTLLFGGGMAIVLQYHLTFFKRQNDDVKQKVPLVITISIICAIIATALGCIIGLSYPLESLYGIRSFAVPVMLVIALLGRSKIIPSTLAWVIAGSIASHLISDSFNMILHMPNTWARAFDSTTTMMFSFVSLAIFTFFIQMDWLKNPIVPTKPDSTK